jgi:hypothetical protein
VPVVGEGVGFPVPLPGVPSIGVADCACARDAAARIAAPAIKPSEVFFISYLPSNRPNANLMRRLL